MQDPLNDPSMRVVVRPQATPLPLGFVALCVATFSLSAVQLGWISQSQGSTIALAVLGLAVPLQLLASVMGFLARDPIAATGMGLLAGTWAAVTLTKLASPPGSFSSGLGVVLLVAGACLLIPAVAGWSKPVAALVILVSGIRFAITGIAELQASQPWLTAAGWVGVVLAALSLYAALAFEIEGVQHRDILPLFRRAMGKEAIAGGLAEQLEDVHHEAGVRRQL